MPSRAPTSNDPSYSLLHAVRSGDLETSTIYLDKYGLSYFQSWSEGYNLLREALQHKQEDIAKLLITRGAKVNSKSRRQSETPLHTAVTNGYAEIVDMLLSRGANVNAKDQSDVTPFHCAVKNGILEIVKSLMKKEPYLEARTKSDMTPLYLAVQSGHFRITELLLARGANINAPGTASWKQGITALHYAASSGDETLVNLLLNQGADINANMETPLHVATDMNHGNIVKVLLSRGASIDKRDKHGKTILCLAVEKGNLPMVKQILEAQPDLRNADNRNCFYTAIHASNGGSSKQIVDALLAYGFGVCADDAKDSKLLHAAVGKGYVKIVEDLLKFGANVDEPHEYEKGRILLHTAVTHRQYDIVRLLIENNASINAKDENGKSPLYCAIEVIDPVIVKFLLDKGANAKGRPNILHAAVKTLRKDLVEMILRHEPKVNVNTREKFGITALYCAIVAGAGISKFVRYARDSNTRGAVYAADIAKRDIVRILVDNEARVNGQTKNGVTALHAAAERGYERVVELLLERNANVNAVDKRKSTPLHAASREGNKTIVGMLLERGAIVNVKQADGASPLSIAIKGRHAQAVRLLVESGADIADKNSDGANSLHCAAARDQAEIVLILVQSFEDIDSRDRNGRTALHIATTHGRFGNVDILLDHDPDINVTCNDGKTPLDYATMRTSAYAERHIEDIFDHEMEASDTPDDDSDDSDFLPDDWNYSDDEIENCYNYFDDDFDDSSSIISNNSYDIVIDIIARHIVKMIALNRHVSEKNLRALDRFEEYGDFLAECKAEVEAMRHENIADSNISFYDILTKGMNQLALYARNKSIVDALEARDHRDEFKLYTGLIDSRFKKSQKREGLLDSSLKSFSLLSGYALPDLEIIDIFKYLSNKDLENLIKAAPSEEFDG